MPRPSTPEGREANRQYQRKWWLANKEVQRARIKANKIKNREASRELVVEAKSGGCTRCGEKDLRCLDLHHLDAGEKEFGVSEAVQRGWTPARVAEEIAKCIVLCANCHRKEHSA
jgi:hypothetical protein